MFEALIIERRKSSRDYDLTELDNLSDKIRYRRKPISLKNCLIHLGSMHKNFATAAYICDNNLSLFKQNIHVAVLCNAASWTLEEDKEYPHTLPGYLWEAVLSDSPKAIQTLTDIQPSHLNEFPNSGEMWSYLWLNAILGNDVAIRAELPRIEKKGAQKERKDIREGRDFWTLLLAGDQTSLEQRILYDAETRSDDAIFSDLMSPIATAQAKLCHMRGIPVEIDHPRVPMDLVRVAPLPSYDDVYDFLAPDYEPPPQGLVGHIKAFFKK
jgi:hypothetical protein